MLKYCKTWFNERFGIDDLVSSKFRLFPVPKDAGFMSTLGAVALVAFLIQVLTGILLIMYYVPHPDHAFTSVQIITNEVPFGWLFRLMHVAGANLLIIVLFVHLAHVFWKASYKKPRELTWLTGAITLFLVFGFSITGSLLPWNQLSYWSTTVVTSIPSVLPWAGEWISLFLRGGTSISGITLSRFYAFHVAVLPIIAILFGWLHVFSVWRIGFAPSLKEERLPWKEFRHELHTVSKPYYPVFFTEQLRSVMLYLAAVFFIIAFFPDLFFGPGSHVVANPLQTPADIRPHFYFRAFQKVLEIVPNKTVGVCIHLIIAVIFLFWPFFDTEPERNIAKRPILLFLFFLTVVLWFVFTIWGGY